MLELKPRPTVRTSQARRAESQQPRRLLLALLLLLGALAAVLIRDREFWFGSEQAVIESDVTEPTAPAGRPLPTANVGHTTAAASAKRRSFTQNSAAPQPSAATQATESPVVTRTVLPPLDVEVIAGDTHRTLRPGSNSTKVELTNSGTFTLHQSSDLAAATNAAEREPIPADAAQTQTYPLLAQHMNVQGSVVLQALIGADGVVESLRVLSGPAILSSAAQQAVREWRFKPIIQNGQAVESKARITVNFTIKVADNSVKTTLAESRTDQIQVLSR